MYQNVKKIKWCANLNNFNYIFDLKMSGSSCIAPKCDIGYDSNKGKVYKFSVPKCLKKREKWQRAINSLKPSCK